MGTVRELHDFGFPEQAELLYYYSVFYGYRFYAYRLLQWRLVTMGSVRELHDIPEKAELVHCYSTFYDDRFLLQVAIVTTGNHGDDARAVWPSGRSEPTASPGVSNFFSSGARLKTAGAQRFEAEGFTEARSAERGRVGRGSPPPAGGDPGGLPREIFGKLPQNGAFLGILEQLLQSSKPKIYMKIFFSNLL